MRIIKYAEMYKIFKIEYLSLNKVNFHRSSISSVTFNTQIYKMQIHVELKQIKIYEYIFSKLLQVGPFFASC